MSPLANFSKIKTIVLDVDGVLTNSQMLITEAGEYLRSMNTRDGFAIKHAVSKGYQFCVVTGGHSAGVSARLKNLGIQTVHSGIQEKAIVLQQYIEMNGLKKEEILYMGDDVIDLPAMELCGVKACPSDAVEEVQQLSDYIALRKGGEGCVREVLEKVLRLQSNWKF